jgi:ankyrin repeat protein
LEVIELLISYGADAQPIFQDNFFSSAELGDMPLQRLCSKNWSPIADRIRLEKFIKEKWHFSSLHAASYEGDTEILSCLLVNMSAQSDLSDIVDEHGWNPLHVAVFMNRIHAAKLLLTKAGATILSAKTKTGATVFHLASARGHSELLKIFLIPVEPIYSPVSSFISSSAGKAVEKKKKTISSISAERSGAFSGFKKGFLESNSRKTHDKK